MPVKIRLARRGRRKNPFYHIIVADSRAPRDGRFIEKIGTYNPMTTPATIELDSDKAMEWLGKGAQPTYTTRAILRYRGILYKRHLQKGVAKGALTQEKADQLFNDWKLKKDEQIADSVAASRVERDEFLKKVSGEIKSTQQAEATEEDQAAFREGGDVVAEPDSSSVADTAKEETVAPTPEVEEKTAPAEASTEEEVKEEVPVADSSEEE